MLAIDVPSGGDTDAGHEAAPTIHATETATFFSMKSGFDRSASDVYCGTVHILDIGIPPQPVAEKLL